MAMDFGSSPRHGRASGRISGALVACLALAGCAFTAPPASPSPGLAGDGSPTPGATPMGQNVQVSARAALPTDGATTTEATQAVAGFGSVWVPQLGDPHGWIVRIAASSGRVVARIPVGGAPGSLAIADGSVWVANSLGGTPAASGANTLSRIDPGSNRVIATVKVEVGGPIAGGYGAVFVPGLTSGGSPVRKVAATSNKVVATFSTIGIPTMACGSLWVTQTLPRDRPPYPVIITRIDPTSGVRIASVTIVEGGSPPAEANGRCLTLTGPNSPSEEPTESWIAIIDPADASVSRSPRIPFRTSIMAGWLWIRGLNGVIQRIDTEGSVAGPRFMLPSREVEDGNWTILTVDGETWIVGSRSAARIALS